MVDLHCAVSGSWLAKKNPSQICKIYVEELKCTPTIYTITKYDYYCAFS